MPFDMGFNFRANAGYVTDPNYCVPVLGELYPHTYTNVNGDSINAGFDSAPSGTVDRINDATQGFPQEIRLAGINYKSNNGSPVLFKVDLSSGSAPGAGTYTVDLAVGDFNFSHQNAFQVKDTNTVLIDGTAGTPAQDSPASSYWDATLTLIPPDGGNPGLGHTVWAGTPVNKVFSTTLAQIALGTQNIGDNTCVAHFRLTLVEGPSFTPAWAARANVILMPGRPG